MNRHHAIAVPCSRTLAGLLCLSVFIGVSAASPNRAMAATPAEMRKAEALATEAKVFFGSKLYKEAALQFMEAFALSRRPSLVYNAARAYEEGGLLNKAVALFRHYLSLDDVDAAGKKAARARMNALERKLAAEKAADDSKRAAAARAARLAAQAAKARQDKARQDKARQDKARQDKARQDKARQDKARAATAAVRRAEAARRAGAHRPAAGARSLNRWWAGASVVALVTSGVAYGVALSQAGDMSAADVVDDVTRDRYLSNRDSAQAWRGFAIGAGIIGAGMAGWTAWQWWRGVPPKKGATNLWIAPTVSSDRAGFMAGLHF